MEVACSCVCDLDLAAAQVLWVILVNIWYLSKLNIRCGQTFDHRSNPGKYLHVLDFGFDSKLVEENSHRRLLSQAKSLGDIGHLKK